MILLIKNFKEAIIMKANVDKDTCIACGACGASAPDIYDYDMIEKAKEFYSLFWNYELTDEEAEEMLANSTLKQRREF